MKKYLYFFYLIIIITLSFGQNKQNNFQNFSWGQSKEFIKSNIKKTPVNEEKNFLIYSEETIANFPCFIQYSFVDNKFAMGVYTFIQTHSNDNDFIADYENLIKLLTKKYNNPKENIIEWKNDSYKDDKNHWGFAISMGYLLYKTVWETKDTRIVITLDGDNYKIDLDIQYQSLELRDKLIQSFNEKSLKDL